MPPPLYARKRRGRECSLQSSSGCGRPYSPTTAFLTAVLFLGIQQLEGNFLTPKIQGNTLRVHPVLVFLAVIVGGGLGGIIGVIVAVPSLAVGRVLFDFFRVRLTTED